MLTRRYKGLPPRLTFTADFHELVNGDCRAGPCLLRYDPFRIVPPNDFASPGAMECFVRFLPSGNLWQKALSIPRGVLRPEYWDPASQGFMLEMDLDLPKDCDELEIWFSYVESSGGVRWDSASGKNYHIRFPLRDLDELMGLVSVSLDSAFDRLQVHISSVPEVDSIELRWQVTSPVDLPRRETALVASPGDKGYTKWSTPDGGVPVPTKSTVVFDLVYRVHGYRHTDDNAGTWYLAQPEKAPNAV
jgi:hypothetical protein